MLLDRASTVKEATAMLDEYNMWMDEDKASYHFFMADATGDFAIVEYTYLDGEPNPTRKEVLTGEDALRFVTNFYVSPTMADNPDGIKHSSHGKRRYEILDSTLLANNYKLNPAQVMELLHSVSQGPEVTLSTGFTQWSETINLTKKKVTMSILREYDKKFEFTIE